MITKDWKFILSSFIGWRVLLYLILFLAARFVPPQQNFLGGGMGNYLKAPWFWAWANFDGEHYLAIAQIGYQPLTYFFFPVYPILIKSIGSLVGKSLPSLNLIGQIVSNISFLAALIGLYKLIRIDFSEKVARLSILLLLLFPTSFYFAAIYTESVFLAFSVWAFYFARKEKWLFAGLLGMILSATRVIGVIISPVLLIEAYMNKRKLSVKHLPLMLIPMGLLAYMYFLWVRTGDMFNFFNTVGIFGVQRSTSLVTLLQVFYRYIFKVLPNINTAYFPGFFTTILEFTVACIFTVVSFISFWKLRLSYAVYLTLGFLIPTLSGSFSSLPRYVLVLFPAFILFSFWLGKLPKAIRFICYTILLIGLVVSLSLFSRGYWLA